MHHHDIVRADAEIDELARELSARHRAR